MVNIWLLSKNNILKYKMAEYNQLNNLKSVSVNWISNVRSSVL